MGRSGRPIFITTKNNFLKHGGAEEPEANKLWCPYRCHLNLSHRRVQLMLVIENPLNALTHVYCLEVQEQSGWFVRQP